MSPTKEQRMIANLLSWYDKNARNLPWRYNHGEPGNPYHTWLSEVMLQQTTVATVRDYFQRFIARWPTLHDLAQASENSVLTEWQGLGYYSRARNLLKCAQHIKNELGGIFPKNVIDLLRLPGIGPYTANAISSIAFAQQHVPVDGNVIRVMARLYGIETPLPELKNDIEKTVLEYVPNPKPGDFAQALMDLGATVCRPKNPTCEMCPVGEGCVAITKGLQSDIPYRKPKKIKPTRFTKAFLIYDKEGRLRLQKRPDKGLLANMMEVPSTPWLTDEDIVDRHFDSMSSDSKLTPLDQKITHTFTHFHLKIDVYHGGIHDLPESMAHDNDILWVHQRDLAQHPLPTLMKKIIAAGNI